MWEGRALPTLLLTVARAWHPKSDHHQIKSNFLLRSSFAVNSSRLHITCPHRECARTHDDHHQHQPSSLLEVAWLALYEECWQDFMEAMFILPPTMQCHYISKYAETPVHLRSVGLSELVSKLRSYEKTHRNTITTTRMQTKGASAPAVMNHLLTQEPQKHPQKENTTKPGETNGSK
eukprot:2375041-Amphidinium_carterae.1